MKIITLTHSNLEIPSGKKVLDYREYQHFLKAENILQATKKRISHIEKKAKQAYQKEKKRGFEEGMMESRIEQSEQMLKIVDRTINYLAEVENTMAGILMSAVKKIMEDFDDKKLVAGLIKSALQHVRNEHEVTVRVSPSQFQSVKEHVNEILADYKGIGFINPVSDPRLSNGNCILESKIGVIDASVDVQIAALKRRFSKITQENMSEILKSAEDSDKDTK